MGKKYRLSQAAMAARSNSGDEKKKTLAAATGPAGVLFKQETAKDAANFDRTNDMMAEYVGFTLGPVASKAVRTLTRPVATIGEKPERKYQPVMVAPVEGGIPTIEEVTNRYNEATQRMIRW
jgi:hypothetical protein